MSVMTYRPHKNGVDDLVLLTNMSNESVMAVLQQHYNADEIYVYIGHVLIAVNPYKEIRGLYSEVSLKRYKSRLPFENPPHVYALAESVHRTMIQQRDNHCVIISGESGAGKTENSKKIMEYIAAVSSKAAGVVKVKQQILESNPLLEAFGNAKTLRNDNSSRFGKYFEIQFDYRGDPVGGKIRNYLLEKIRVVYQQQGERCFHIFYQLLAGASKNEHQEYELYDAQYYRYLNQSGCFEVKGVNDQSDYNETKNAMKVIGMTDDEISECFRMVAAILHIGNVTFKEDAKHKATVDNKKILDIAARLLRSTPALLEKAMTCKTIQANREVVTSPLSADEANFSRDSLAKTIYGRVFDWIVHRCNDLMYREEHEGTVIGVLDIYGFEIFGRNSFEQLCINFCNEKLHQIFIELTLKAEQEEYKKEKIPWEDVKYYNNKPCVELIEQKQGILGFLDEECLFPKGTDLTFHQKIFAQIKSHPNFAQSTAKRCFVVKHYAGEVVYDVEGWLDKNRDQLYPDSIQMLGTSGSHLLKSLFERDLSLLKDTKKRPLTAGTQFKNQMQQLMESLMACTPHYIRCIKPNTNKRAAEWNDELCMSQIKYLGLLENIRVRRAGYAFRLVYGHFLRRYKMLCKETWPVFSGSERDGSQKILQAIGVQNDWAFGTTKIFIKSPETVFKLEELREKALDHIVVKIQRAWRAFMARKWYLELRAAMQDIFYGKKERRRGSINRKYHGDYLRVQNDPSMKLILSKFGDHQVLFADAVWKTNRSLKQQKRILVVTEKSVFLLAPGKKLSLRKRNDVVDITGVHLSALADDYFMVSFGGQFDFLLQTKRKTEVVVCLKELLQKSSKTLTVSFNNQLTFNPKPKKPKSVRFETDASAVEGGAFLKQGDSVVIKVAPGLPPNTTPSATYKSKAQRAAAGGGGGGGYGQTGAPSWAAHSNAATSNAPSWANEARGGASGGGGGGGGGGGALAGKKAPPPRPGQNVRQQSVIALPTAVALYDYVSQAPDELNLKEGDVVEVVSKDASGWWTGKFKGRQGLFPGNYVKENPSGPLKLDRANYPYGA